MAFSPSVIPASGSEGPLHYMAEPHETPIVKPYSIQTPVSQRGEHIGIKSTTSANEKKCQVYVHQFSKIPRSTSSYLHSKNNWLGGNESHQSAYKHEKSDYYDAKIQCFRRQFDNLTLNEKTRASSGVSKMSQNMHLPNKNSVTSNIHCCAHSTKIPVVKSSPNAKINRLLTQRPDQHKATLDKLEEQYWAKWKPSRNTSMIKPYVKPKKCYAKNDQEKSSFPTASIKRSKKEESEKSIKPRKTSSDKLIYVQQAESVAECSEIIESTGEEKLDEPLPELEDVTTPEPELPNETVVPIQEIPKESESECVVTNLKHTDSLILASKKQIQETGKPHYQQPKCIKLFKNVGCAPITMTSFIKGGSYPLKSCLKRDTFGLKSPRLGRPGSPIVLAGSARKSGKSNRYSKS